MNRRSIICGLAVIFSAGSLFAQTSWKGTVSTEWGRASNWTNGIPTASVNAIIGDANFTGSHQPAVTASSSCKSLSIGNGTKISILTVGRALSISGNLTIGVNGTLAHTGRTITLSGNWNNSGSYTHTNNTGVTFSGD